MHKSSVCTRIQELNYKLVSRWYMVPTTLHRFFPETSDRCWRCGEEGSLLHIFWSCPSLERFWSSVREICQLTTGLDPGDDPAACLLHLTGMDISKYKRSLLVTLLDAAKACIPVLWKSSTPPGVRNWLDRVNNIMRLEELSSSLAFSHERWLQKWYHWVEFRNSDSYERIYDRTE